MNTLVDWYYIWGLFEGDGNFSLIFSKDKSMTVGYKMRPELQITQKNLVLLSAIKETFFANGITSRIKTYPNDKSKRSPCLVSEGVVNMRKLLEQIRKSNIVFYSQKHVSHRIMIQIMKLTKDNYHNTIAGRKQIIDLKFWLNEPVKLSSDVVNSFLSYLPKTKCRFITKDDMSTHIERPKAFRKEREQIDEQHSFPKNSSMDASLNIVNSIHEEYFKLITDTISLLEKQKVKPISDESENLFNLKPYFVAGLIDSDGCISVNNTLCFYFELGSELIHLVISSYFGDYHRNIYQLKNKNCTTIQFSKRKTLKQFVSLLEENHFQIKGSKFTKLKNILEQKKNI